MTCNPCGAKRTFAVPTTATRHARYGMGMNGRLVHITAHVSFYWRNGHLPRYHGRLSGMYVTWLCGATSAAATLLHQPPLGMKLCRRCLAKEGLPE